MLSATNVVLSGSFARGAQTPHSDLDFIVISENVTSFFTETIHSKGNEIQVIYFPKTKIHKMLMEYSNDNQGIIISMLKSCVIISDEDQFANKLSSYAKTVTRGPSERILNTYVSILRSRCDDLRHATNSLEKDLFASSIFVLLSHFIAYDFVVGDKYSIRATRRSPHYKEFCKIVGQYRQDQKVAKVLEYVEKIVSPFYQDISSTGMALNHFSDKNSIMVYFPQKTLKDAGMKALLDVLLPSFEGCCCFAFQQEKWQAMNEGLYVYVDGRTVSATDIIKRIAKTDLSIAKSRMSLGIEMAYPYYTSFESGVYFGGRSILDKLTPAFSAIWDAYYAGISINNREASIQQFSFVAAILIIRSILAQYINKGGQMIAYFNCLAWLLLPETVNPNGFCCVEQTARLKRIALDLYYERYEEKKDSYKSVYEDVISHNILELKQMYKSVELLDSCLSQIPIEGLTFPDTSPFESALDIFFTEVCLICLSIIQLSSEEKFSAVYHVARLHEVCLNDSL